jgi:hypothetical protein
MKCLSCDVILDDKEQSRKYKNHFEIKNPEDRYIGLCNRCLRNGELDADELESVFVEEGYE